MSINAYNGSTGTTTVLANGQRLWLGTQAAHDAAVARGDMVNNCLVAITDDYPSDSHYVDKDISNDVTVNTGTLATALLSRDNNVYELKLRVNNISVSGTTGTNIATIDTTKIPWIGTEATYNMPVSLSSNADNVVIAVIRSNGNITAYSQGSSSASGTFELFLTYIA